MNLFIYLFIYLQAKCQALHGYKKMTALNGCYVLVSLPVLTEYNAHTVRSY